MLSGWILGPKRLPFGEGNLKRSTLTVPFRFIDIKSILDSTRLSALSLSGIEMVRMMVWCCRSLGLMQTFRLIEPRR